MSGSPWGVSLHSQPSSILLTPRPAEPPERTPHGPLLLTPHGKALSPLAPAAVRASPFPLLRRCWAGPQGSTGPSTPALAPGSSLGAVSPCPESMKPDPQPPSHLLEADAENTAPAPACPTCLAPWGRKSVASLLQGQEVPCHLPLRPSLHHAWGKTPASPRRHGSDPQDGKWGIKRRWGRYGKINSQTLYVTVTSQQPLLTWKVKAASSFFVLFLNDLTFYSPPSNSLFSVNGRIIKNYPS